MEIIILPYSSANNLLDDSQDLDNCPIDFVTLAGIGKHVRDGNTIVCCSGDLKEPNSSVFKSLIKKISDLSKVSGEQVNKISVQGHGGPGGSIGIGNYAYERKKSSSLGSPEDLGTQLANLLIKAGESNLLSSTIDLTMCACYSKTADGVNDSLVAGVGSKIAGVSSNVNIIGFIGPAVEPLDAETLDVILAEEGSQVLEDCSAYQSFLSDNSGLTSNKGEDDLVKQNLVTGLQTQVNGENIKNSDQFIDWLKAKAVEFVNTYPVISFYKEFTNYIRAQRYDLPLPKSLIEAAMMEERAEVGFEATVMMREMMRERIEFGYPQNNSFHTEPAPSPTPNKSFIFE